MVHLPQMQKNTRSCSALCSARCACRGASSGVGSNEKHKLSPPRSPSFHELTAASRCDHCSQMCFSPTVASDEAGEQQVARARTWISGVRLNCPWSISVLPLPCFHFFFNLFFFFNAKARGILFNPSCWGHLAHGERTTLGSPSSKPLNSSAAIRYNVIGRTV